MSALFPNYARWEIKAQQGNGSTLVDENGKEYLDFIAGIAVCNLGHCHPKVQAAVEKQLGTLWHASNLFQFEGQEKVAEILASHSVGDYVFFCNSGAEANEAAIKLARKATGKHHIVSLKNSFHGRTLGSMAATGQEKIHAGFGPLLSEFTYVELNDIDALEQVVTDQTAAIMVEVIQGEGGIRLMSKEYAKQLAHICKKFNCLLIIDEVQTGIGRTGTAFAYEHLSLSPDIITLAKGLGNGFPVGAMIGKEALKEAFSAGSHGSTFGGNPLAMAAAEAVLTEILNPTFLESVQKKGDWFKNQLEENLKSLAIVDEIRGKGLMLGIACQIEVAPIITACREKGLLVLPAGPNVLRILPPLIVTQQELEKAVSILTEVVTNLSEKQATHI
ncbi:acetylornithine transaminase [Halalkalibacter nanhaiisediminis]|uniref:Acetylornithine aminotransferase n=1 Tax=Halalkalibacter nanhaiisediminis TaxID=688079 RepID=A0A562QKC7_9BACI|nr:acetylornithine transaminase [Halalkalibacter nanhaiisediminis]TWI57212.1 acetylornithine aminotransferase [Halalkalibacter nanhaiisediminis]